MKLILTTLLLGAALSASAQTLTSLSRVGSPAHGITDAVYGAPGYASISPSGVVLFETALTGPGAPVSRNRALMAADSSTDLYVPKGFSIGGVLGLPATTKVSALSPFLINASVGVPLVRFTMAGPGLTSSNNQLLLVGPDAAHRTGAAEPAVGGAMLSTYTEIVQRGSNPYAVGYKLKPGTGTPATTAASDSGLILFSSTTGALVSPTPREGSPVGGSVVGTFAQFGRAASISGGYTTWIAKWISAPGALPLDALFFSGPGYGQAAILQGAVAGGTTAGEKYGTFTGVTAYSGGLALVRANLTGSPTSTNQGVWSESGLLLLRKGDTIAPGLKVAKIIRVWGVNLDQMVAQVTFAAGSGVTAANNQAVILRQSDGAFLILARSGSSSASTNPGVIASIQAVDVDPINGHYIILTSVKGTGITAANNQQLVTGLTRLGDDGINQGLRLPVRRYNKGDNYSTSVTSSATIKSIAIKPALDPSGVGGRGLAQVINSNGQFVATFTGLAGAQELVRFTP